MTKDIVNTYLGAIGLADRDVERKSMTPVILATPLRAGDFVNESESSEMLEIESRLLRSARFVVSTRFGASTIGGDGSRFLSGSFKF